MTTTQDVEGLAGSEGSASRRRLGLDAPSPSPIRQLPLPNQPHQLLALSITGVRKAVGSTASISPRENTDSESTDTDAAIYWLGNNEKLEAARPWSAAVPGAGACSSQGAMGSSPWSQRSGADAKPYPAHPLPGTSY